MADIVEETLLAQLRDPDFTTDNCEMSDNTTHKEMVHAYAQRDMEFYPQKTIIEWRAEIDERLAGGHPYGKFNGEVEMIPKFEAWQNAIAGLPKTTHPRIIYSHADADVLHYLGW